MLVVLHSLLLSLQSSSDLIKKQWRTLFDFELSRLHASAGCREPDIVLEAELVSTLPPSPILPASYLTIDPPLAVYPNLDGKILLRLSNRAQIQLELSDDIPVQSSSPTRAQILITEHLFSEASFEDITTFALAPLLRRHGLFMIHAFTTAINGEAVMFVGPSGSGKTTCGLALTAAGWQLLANDVALMQESDTAHAFLSPGTVHVSPTTFSLLPKYRYLLTEYAHDSSNRKIAVPRLEFLPANPVTMSAPIKAVFFPTIANQEKHLCEEIMRGIGLARLMESSMDQWDQQCWAQHIGFLERLSQGISFQSLYLGDDMVRLPAFLEDMMARV